LHERLNANENSCERKQNRGWIETQIDILRRIVSPQSRKQAQRK